MNIGIVSYWFNRGQATVSRQVRAIFDELGHRTFVLARPTKSNFTLSSFVSDQDVWKQDRVQPATAFDISRTEYLEWVKNNNIDVVFFDQNYQFEQIASLRAEGVKTIGRFVWEDFGAEHVEDAKEALDVIYSVTRCEVQRYSEFGIDSPYVRWGCFPELNRYRQSRENEGQSFLYVGGYMSVRKPSAATVRAFREVELPDIELILKIQRDIDKTDFVIPENIADLSPPRRRILGDDSILHGDSRIKVINKDMSHDEYLRLFAECDVSLAPSRWEGLGLHLFEAQSLGIPTISCDIAPINEVIEHGLNGLLVECRPIGTRKNGLKAYEPTIEGLKTAITALNDPVCARDLAMGTAEVREKRNWRFTKSDYAQLLSM